MNTISRTSPTTRVLRCESTADFLAALPQLVGFTATNSLFVVFFAGKRSGNAIRIDLPASEDPPILTQFIADLESILQDIDGSFGASEPAVVITSARSFADAGGAPWRRLARGLKRRLERNGVKLRELCCLAPDAWVSYLDHSAPQFGRSLNEIAASPVVDVLGPPPTLESLGAFPSAAPAKIAAVSAALDAPALRSAEECAAALVGTSELDDSAVAGIIHAANTEDGCIALFDQLFATAAVMLEKPPHTSPFTSEISNHASRQTSASHEATVRLRLSSERLTTIVPLTPARLQPAVIAICALAWWFRGLQSVSHKQIKVALDLDPAHETANIVRRIMDSEHFPMRN